MPASKRSFREHETRLKFHADVCGKFTQELLPLIARRRRTTRYRIRDLAPRGAKFGWYHSEENQPRPFADGAFFFFEKKEDTDHMDMQEQLRKIQEKPSQPA